MNREHEAADTVQLRARLLEFHSQHHTCCRHVLRPIIGSQNSVHCLSKGFLATRLHEGEVQIGNIRVIDGAVYLVGVELLADRSLRHC